MNYDDKNMEIIINWYPGHMKKTKEQIAENLKLVDVVIEIVDARAPISTSNPDIDELVKTLPKVVVLNKEDLSDPILLKSWMDYYKSKNYESVAVNSLTGKGIKDLLGCLNNKSKALYESLARRGRRRRPLRVMVVGIPNVGKSSIINKIIGKKSTQTGDRPGVTKGKQWVKLKGDLELLDTPGVLWPKIEDQDVALKLAFLGSIKDDVIEIEEIAVELIKYISKVKPSILSERFKIEEDLESIMDIIEAIAKKRGYILPGAEIDFLRLSSNLLHEFRSGKLGKITLESPDDFNKAI